MIVLLILLVMVLASSWIALGVIPLQRWRLYKHALFAVVAGGSFTLLVMTTGVLALDPWYDP